MQFTGKTESVFPIYLGSMQSTAFVKPVETERGRMFAVCCAEDAQVLATYATQDAAMCAAIQHELKPVVVH